MDTVVNAEILIQLLFALGVISLPEYVEKLSVMTVDDIVNIPMGIPNVTMNPKYRYTSLLGYFIHPQEEE